MHAYTNIHHKHITCIRTSHIHNIRAHTHAHTHYTQTQIHTHSFVHMTTACSYRYFIDAPTVNGELYIRGIFQYSKTVVIIVPYSITYICIRLVFNMQKCMDGVNQDCIAANTGEEWKCFMAQVRRLYNTQYM